MNIKKIGLTALATTLVAGSAYAAEVSVSGGAGFTFVTQTGNSGSASDNGKGFGTDNNLSFSASGELDNGWSVSAATAFTDAATLSSSSVSLTMGSFGTIKSGNGFGGPGGSYDGIAGAYEEVDDGAGTTLSANFLGSQFDNGSIQYTPPAVEAAGATVQLHLAYAPRGNDVALAGGVADGTALYGSATFAGVTISHDSGLTFGIAGQQADKNGSANLDDFFQGNWYAKYAMGPVSVGYLVGYADTGINAAATSASTATKTVAAAGGIFESEEYVISFNVNDNLSVSYAKAEDTYDAQAGAAAGATTGGAAVADVAVDHKSIQAAYSMGSMSIKAYRQETSNVGYRSSGGGSHTKNEIALGLTF